MLTRALVSSALIALPLLAALSPTTVIDTPMPAPGSLIWPR